MASTNLNRWVGTGNLTRDPELKQTDSGTKIANLRIAVNGRIKRGDDWVEKPNFFDVVVFGKQADSIGTYLTKGSSVAIDGRLDYQEWEADDGSKRSRVSIIADSVQFTDSRDGSEDTGRGESVSAGGAGDDIPF
jgi:single-strand DNA-binding protein